MEALAASVPELVFCYYVFLSAPIPHTPASKEVYYFSIHLSGEDIFVQPDHEGQEGSGQKQRCGDKDVWCLHVKKVSRHERLGSVK